LVLLAAPSVHGAGDNVFAGTQAHTFDIQFSQPAWWDSLTTYYDDGDEQYLAATVIIDGEAHDSVGVRFKGNASYTHPNDKKPFRLKFDAFRENLRWDELKGVHLNNCWEDPTFMREKLHLDFCRDAGIPAPRGNFAELSLNGELWGFYSLVEHVDGLFVDSRFGNSGGNRYKAVDGLLNPLRSDFRWYGSDSSGYVTRYELKTDNADSWTDLIAVIDSLNNTPDVATALPPVVNLRNLYRAIGTDLLMASLDSYAGSCRNFYCYFSTATGTMEWIVWDAGMSFGSYWGDAQNYETLSITY
jgi:spore coat protein CotH